MNKNENIKKINIYDFSNGITIQKAVDNSFSFIQNVSLNNSAISEKVNLSE